MRLSVNPYKWQKVNPDFLYGSDRLKLLVELVGGLSNGHSFGITGGRRMGKTTLLRRIEKELLKYTLEAKRGGFLVIPIYIETLTLPSPISSDALYQEMMQILNLRLSEQDITFSSDSQVINVQTFKEYLCNVINLVTRYRLQFVFIFDEIELIGRSEWGGSFFANWRSLLTNTPSLQQYLSAVFSGADEMFKITRDVGSPLGNTLEWRELELLSSEDICHLICEPTQYKWTTRFVGEVYEASGGHPFITQYLMQAVCSSDVDSAAQSLEEAKLGSTGFCM